jgi:hypothetical protein
MAPPGRIGYHGTRMLSKMVGSTVGLARRATPIITVIPYDTYIIEHFIDALQLVYTSILEGDRGPQSVVNMSLNFKTWSCSPGFITALRDLINALIGLGVVVTTGTGNNPYPTPINGYPALFKDPASPNYIADLLLVGGALQLGDFDAGVQWAAYQDTAAPSSVNRVPDPSLGLDGYSSGRGTSICKFPPSSLRGHTPNTTLLVHISS